MHSQTIRVADREIVAGVALNALDPCALNAGPQPLCIEIVNADAEVVYAPRCLAFLQDNQPSTWQIKSVVVWPLNPSAQREPEQVPIERLRARNIRNPHIHMVQITAFHQT